MTTRREALLGWRLMRGLQPILRAPLDVPRARAALRDRLEAREATR